MHACELGAVGVYRGHKCVARYVFRQALPEIDDMRSHEINHVDIFRQLLDFALDSQGQAARAERLLKHQTERASTSEVFGSFALSPLVLLEASRNISCNSSIELTVLASDEIYGPLSLHYSSACRPLAQPDRYSYRQKNSGEHHELQKEWKHEA